MRFKINRYINLPKTLIYLLFGCALLGTQLFSIQVGVEISLYRILLPFAILCVLVTKKNDWWKLRFSINGLYFSLLLVWVCYSIISLPFIIDKYSWFKSFFFLFTGSIFSLLIGLYIKEKNDFIKMFKIFNFFAFIFSLIGLYEMITGNYLFFINPSVLKVLSYSNETSDIGLYNPVSIFVNPNNYSLFLIFAIYNSILLWKMGSMRVEKIKRFIFCIFFFFLLIGTQSRSGFIALLLGLFTMMMVYFMNSSGRKMLGRALLIALICIIGGIIFIDHRDIFYSLMEFNFNQKGGSDLIRFNLLRNGFEMSKDYYFLGVGLGNIEYHMSRSIFDVGRIVNMHNWWAEIFVSSGIIIFVLYIICYIKNIWALYWYTRQKKGNDLDSAYIFFALSISFIIACVGPSSCLNLEWFFPMIALIMAYTNFLYKGSKI